MRSIDYSKKITVYDNIFTDKENLDIYEFISRSNFTRSNVDVQILHNRDIDVKWRSDIDPANPLSKITIPIYRERIEHIDWNKFHIKSHYVNFSVSNTVDMIHPDSRGFEKNGFTLLHYANYKWDINWHGNTNFYSDNLEDVVYSSLIKPGRIVIFDSTIPHSATAPSSIAMHPRYTIATKLILDSEHA